MDRRKYLKTLAAGAITTGVILEACEPKSTEKKEVAAAPTFDRTPEELAHYNKLMAEKFFTEHEMKTISTLADIIIPKDEKSGSATEAGVPDFIEFIVKDMPHHQIPMRGGIKWLDIECNKRFEKSFIECSAEQKLQVVDDIAFPEEAKPGMQQGVAFFNLMRDLTATGFYTSKMGIADIGYMGNQPNQWDGVPQDVLDQYGMKYDERTLKESVKFS
jgi:gluconate 2-dehydrogenase gamma chain